MCGSSRSAYVDIRHRYCRYGSLLYGSESSHICTYDRAAIVGRQHQGHRCVHSQPRLIRTVHLQPNLDSHRRDAPEELKRSEACKHLRGKRTRPLEGWVIYKDRAECLLTCCMPSLYWKFRGTWAQKRTRTLRHSGCRCEL